MLRTASVRRALRRFLGRPTHLLGLGWIAAIVGFEILSRRSPSDLYDALGVAVLLSLGTITVLVHRQWRLSLVDRLIHRGAWVRDIVVRHSVRMGVDLREEPPLPRGFPHILVTSMAGLLLALASVTAFRFWFPTGLRHAALVVSGTLYVVMLTLLWAALATTALFMIAFAGMSLHNWMINSPRFRLHNRVAIEVVVVLGFYGLMLIGGLLLPVWVPLVAIVLMLVVTLVLLGIPGAPRLLALWQARTGGDPRVTPWTGLLAWSTAVVGGGVLTLALVAVGDRVGANDPSIMPITTVLGGAVAWSGAAGYGAWAWLFPIRSFLQRFRDPAVPFPVRVLMQGGQDVDQRGLHALLRAGFDVQWADGVGRTPDGVLLVLDPDAARLGDEHRLETAMRGPLHVHPRDLAHPDLHEAIRRLDEVERRRQARRGLRQLFDFASGRRFEKGHGYWVAPHFWFITHLSRDTDEDDSWFVGPPYHRVIPRAARHQLHRVLRALEIDLIFVEDGVPFRKVELVFRALFDVYDLFGGTRAEERHFDSLPGVRVVIHEFTMEHPFREEGYPDVNYEEIGRARILHVFKDRGDQEDLPEVPIDSDLVDEPALV